jgi:hypothetical protein
MRSRLAAVLSLVFVLGCFSEAHLPNQPVPVSYDNPMLLRIPNHEVVWEGVRDVVSKYFRIDQENQVSLQGNTLTIGWIYTRPQPGATLLEPWDHDSATSYERLESTLQSIRRYAVVKVYPVENGGSGFWVEVAVWKELENVPHPEHATAGSAMFRNDITPSRSDNAGPLAGALPGQPPVSPGALGKAKPGQPGDVPTTWIPQGRDTAVEQRILGEILERFTPEGTPLPVN